jgi:hypothetical protein
MDGVLIVINRLGRALAEAERDIAVLKEENVQLRTSRSDEAQPS